MLCYFMLYYSVLYYITLYYTVLSLDFGIIHGERASRKKASESEKHNSKDDFQGKAPFCFRRRSTTTPRRWQRTTACDASSE